MAAPAGGVNLQSYSSNVRGIQSLQQSLGMVLCLLLLNAAHPLLGCTAILKVGACQLFCRHGSRPALTYVLPELPSCSSPGCCLTFLTGLVCPTRLRPVQYSYLWQCQKCNRC